MGKGNMPLFYPFFDTDHFWRPNHSNAATSCHGWGDPSFVGLLSCNEEDGNFIDDDAWVMEREDITGERDAFDVFVDDDEVF